jgi:hypothetical protein
LEKIYAIALNLYLMVVHDSTISIYNNIKLSLVK